MLYFSESLDFIEQKNYSNLNDTTTLQKEILNLKLFT